MTTRLVLSDERRAAYEASLARGFEKALSLVQRRVAAAVADAATTIVAAAAPEQGDDGREWGALPLTAATVSVAPSAVYHPDWWRSGYQRYVAGPMRRAYQSSTVDVLDGLGVDVDADDPTLDDAWAELDDQVSGEWGAGLGDWVAGQVRQAATDGSSVDEVTASMRGSEDGWFSAGRAVLLAANAAAAAWNRATVASTTAARAQGTSSTKTWVTVGDDKVRDSHVDMDGVSVDAGSDFLVSGAYEAAGPHDARLPVEEVVNCFPAEVVVESPSGVVGGYRRYYSGDLVVIETAGGATLSATPNHPVLTGDGWRPIGAIQPGDQVVRYGLGVDEFGAGSEHEHGCPAMIGEVVEAIARYPLSVSRVIGAGVNFHGDRPDGNVDVVRTDRPLLFHAPAAEPDGISDFRLAPADVTLRPVPACRSLVEFAEGDRLLATPDVGCGGQGAPPFEVGAGHAPGLLFGLPSDRDALADQPLGIRPPRHPAFNAEVVGRLAVEVAADVLTRIARAVPHAAGGLAGTLPARTDGDAIAFEYVEDRGVCDPVIDGHLLGGRAAQIFLDEVAVVGREQWDGFVHNLETPAGWYVANSIPVRNCRCSLMVSADGGDGVDDETTSVGDDGVQLDYETDDGEEPLVASVLGLGPFAAEFHTHGRCLGCGGWLEGRKYCHKCGDGYAGPLLDAGSERPTGVDDDARSDNPTLSAATIEDARDAGQVAAGGVDQEDDPAMTTTAPSAGITVTSGVSTFATTTNGDPAQPFTWTQRTPNEELTARFRLAERSGQFVGAGLGLEPWSGCIAVEGKPTGDGRMFRAAQGDQRGLWWDETYLPADVFAMLQDPDGGSGHDGSAIAGRVDRMWKQATDAGYTEVWAEGVYDTSTPTGAEVFRLQLNRMLTGVSVDVDSVKVVLPDLSPDDMLMEMLFGSGVEEYSEGRIRRITVCSIPAFIEARIYPVSDGGTLVASAAAEGFAGLRAWLPLEGNGQPGTLVASAAAFTTAAPRPVDVFRSALVDVDPPADMFARQRYSEYTLFTVDADGRVSGHVSPFGECHIGFADRCVTAPRSTCGYAHARNAHVLTDDGQLVKTARVFAQFSPGRRAHAPEELSAASAQEWYENQCCAVADVAVFEDDFGIQVQGRVRPGITRNQLVAFRASRISPDWRSISGRLEAVAFAVVNVSGFTTSRNTPALVASAIEAGVELPVEGELRGSAYLADGEVLTLVASGGPGRDPEGPLVGLVQSLAARVDELEQTELARVAAAALAGLPSAEEENARYAAQVAALLDGVELGVDPDPIVDVVVDEVVSVTADELATLRAAAAIAERLSQRPVEAADDGQTQTCPACKATIPAGGDNGVCPECGASLGADDSTADAAVSAEVFAGGMVKCEGCGMLVKADAATCPNCGEAMTEAVVTASASCGCGTNACSCSPTEVR